MSVKWRIGRNYLTDSEREMGAARKRRPIPRYAHVVLRLPPRAEMPTLASALVRLVS